MDLFQSIFKTGADKPSGEAVGIDEVKLVGGFPEPFYQPAQENIPAEIRFTRDYLNSCFHEIAHWCIAGRARRRQDDYGYWYRPDGRDGMAQQAFFQVEAGPQALEWAFATASGEAFQISCDNLAGEVHVAAKILEDRKFTEDVQKKLEGYLVEGFPPRGRKFLIGLMTHFHPEVEEREIAAWLRSHLHLTGSPQREPISQHQ